MQAGGSGQVTVVPLTGRTRRRDWVRVPYRVFAGDPCWIPPLNLVERRRISPKHAPFFDFGETSLFVAYRDGEPVGRISAQINRRYIERHHGSTGHFGFFDCIDDETVARALVSAAEAWLGARGMTRMSGPFNFSLNEECGCLVAGFDSPPAILMTHARPWTGPLLETCGFQKEIDLYAYRIDVTRIPDKMLRLGGYAEASDRVTLRPFDMTKFEQEVEILVDIFNNAWSGNWGFVPFSRAEIQALLAEMRPVFRGNYGRFALLDGRPVGFIACLPNVNDAIANFHGRLFPFNWIKLLWRLKRESIPTVRVPLLGIRKELHGTPTGAALVGLFIKYLVDTRDVYDLQWIELSWILETNAPMVKIAEASAGKLVKTYRIFCKELAS